MTIHANPATMVALKEKEALEQKGPGVSLNVHGNDAFESLPADVSKKDLSIEEVSLFPDREQGLDSILDEISPGESVTTPTPAAAMSTIVPALLIVKGSIVHQRVEQIEHPLDPALGKSASSVSQVGNDVISSTSVQDNNNNNNNNKVAKRKANSKMSSDEIKAQVDSFRKFASTIHPFALKFFIHKKISFRGEAVDTDMHILMVSNVNPWLPSVGYQIREGKVFSSTLTEDFVKILVEHKFLNRGDVLCMNNTPYVYIVR